MEKLPFYWWKKLEKNFSSNLKYRTPYIWNLTLNKKQRAYKNLKDW
jgi:hypothetical protein